MSIPVALLIATITMETAFLIRVSLDLREARKETKEALAALDAVAKTTRMLKSAAKAAQGVIAGLSHR
jgi:hypothetical protein